MVSMALRAPRLVTASALLLVLFLAPTPTWAANKVRVVITSEPNGANVEFNGQFVGTTPHQFDLDDYCFKSPKFLWSNFLNQQIVLRVWKEGYMEKSLSLTSGPYEWVNLNNTARKIYYVVTGTSFHVRLQGYPYLPKPEPVREASSLPLEVVTVTGSGFILPRSGYVVTNHHVVDGVTGIQVMSPTRGKSAGAVVALKDKTNDLAILKLVDPTALAPAGESAVYSIGAGNSVKVGQEVFTLGFPLGDTMGATARLSSGRVDSLFGLEDDPRLYQISNPLHPGNSGGPLFNINGELVGIVVSGLNAKFFYENEGIIPQNMNFAVKATYLKNLLEVLPDAPDLAQRKASVARVPLEQQVELLAPFIVRVTGSRGVGEPSPAPVPSAVQVSDSPDTVYLMQGGVIYHRKDCDSLTGHRAVAKKLFELGPANEACSRCNPLIVRRSGSRGSGGTAPAAPAPEPDASDTVYLMEGGVIYHRKDCDSLAGHRVVAKKLSALGPSNEACSRCKPPAKPIK